MEIIIKDKNKIKGKSISEFAKNLESEGWPSEFVNNEQRDKVKYMERKLGRPLRSSDLPNKGRAHAKDTYRRE
jgi:hypothetical protein